MSHYKPFQTGVLVLLLVVTLGSSRVSELGQEQHYRERQVLEPESDVWVDQTPPTAAGPSDALDEARGLLAANKPRKARHLLEDWLDDNPDDERYYEATYLLGDCYFEMRDYWKAVERYQTVAENAVGELFREANERCVDVGRAFLAGERRIVWRIFRFPAYDEGVEILDRVWERMPGTPLGELALKIKSDYFFERGDMDLAQDEYANLVQQYPSGRYVQLAMLRTAEAAEAAFPGVRFDDRPLIEAQERYRQVLAAFPAYAEHEDVPQRLEGILQQRAEKDLSVARWYEHTGHPGAAEFYYRQILNDWPDTLAGAEARARLEGLGVMIEAPAEPEEGGQ